MDSTVLRRTSFDQRMRSTERNAAPVSLLARAAAVIGAFDDRDPVSSLVELSRRTGLAKSTVHRIAGELVTLRVLERQESGPSGDGYRLGMWLFERGELCPSTGRCRRTRSRDGGPARGDSPAHPPRACSTGSSASTSRSSVPAASTCPPAPVVTAAHATGWGRRSWALARGDRAGPDRRRAAAADPSHDLDVAAALVRELRKIRSVGMALDLEESTPGSRASPLRVRRRPQGGGRAVGHRGHRVDRPRHAWARGAHGSLHPQPTLRESGLDPCGCPPHGIRLSAEVAAIATVSALTPTSRVLRWSAQQPSGHPVLGGQRLIRGERTPPVTLSPSLKKSSRWMSREEAPAHEGLQGRLDHRRGPHR